MLLVHLLLDRFPSAKRRRLILQKTKCGDLLGPPLPSQREGVEIWMTKFALCLQNVSHSLNIFVAAA